MYKKNGRKWIQFINQFDDNSASLQNFNDSYNDDDTVDDNLEDGLKELKESLCLARYQLNKNDDDDKKNNHTYNDDETERTENITDTSFDSYDDNYSKEFVFTTTTTNATKY